MKTTTIKLGLATVIFLISGIAFAQEAKSDSKKENGQLHKNETTTNVKKKTQTSETLQSREENKVRLEEKQNNAAPQSELKSVNSEIKFNSKEEKTLENQEQIRESLPDKFRASLTQEQIEILENPALNRKEKQERFMASLSEEQKLMLQEQNREKAMQGETNSYQNRKDEQLKEQKMHLREQARENNRKEMREQQMQQERANYQNANKHGAETGSGSGNNPGNGEGTQGGNGRSENPIMPTGGKK